MVAPIVGPTASTINLDPLYWRYRQQWKQKMPIDRPLAYNSTLSKSVLRAIWGSGPGLTASSATAGFWQPSAAAKNAANSAAYERLKDQISDRASLGAGLAELGQSTGMIAERATQLYRGVRAIRKLDFQKAATIFGLKRPPQGVSRHKQFASNYLEFHFGWSPLVGDIYSASNVLQEPIKSPFPRGSAKVPSSFLTRTTPPYWPGFDQSAGVARCRMGCEVRVNNPNLWLLNQLGLVNPAVVLWEIVPFSFVVDWFVNVEQFLSTGTDFLGLTVTNSWTSTSMHYTATQYSSSPYHGGTVKCEVTSVNRTLGLTLPSLALRPYKVPGWRRAASAISLLVQGLKH